MERSNRKSIIAILLTVFASLFAAVLVFTFMPTAKKASAEDEISVWDKDLAEVGWGGGEYTPDDRFRDESGKTINIYNANDFAYFAYLSNQEENNGFEGYELHIWTDIDLNNRLWVPIGACARYGNTATAKLAFRGKSIDGHGHTVYNLSADEFNQALSYGEYKSGTTGVYLNVSDDLQIPFDTDGFEYNYGLFGVTANATIRNLNISGVKLDFATSIAGTNSAPIADSVGGLVGYNAGNLTLENCNAGNPDKSDYIKNSLCTSGLVGRVYAGLLNGEAFGDVINKGQGQKDTVDGVTNVLINGYSFGKVYVTNCKNYVNLGVAGDGDKKGGVVGYIMSQVEHHIVDCENYGDVNGEDVGGIISYWQAAGFHGIQTAEDAVSGTASVLNYIYEIDNCKNYGTVVGTKHVGGIFGRVDYYHGNGKYRSSNMYLTDCINYGSVSRAEASASSGSVKVGGLFGNVTARSGAPASILNCYNYGDVIGGDSSNNDSGAGGVIGWLQLAAKTSGIVNVTLAVGNCGKVTGTNIGDGAIGRIDVGYSSEYNNVFVINAYNVKATDTASALSDVTDITDKLVYADDAKTTIVGVDTEDVDGAYSIDIPESVTDIDFAAFVGQSDLVKVTFAKNSSLNTVGDWAFAGTGLNEITLPEGVTSIGAAAFGDCAGLTKVVLPDSLRQVGQAAFGNSAVVCVELSSDVAFDKYAIGGNTYVIADDKERYDALMASDTVGDDIKALLTYIVPVEYYDLSVSSSEPIASELKLFGKDYKTVCDANGIWSLNNNIDYVGLPELSGNKTAWYADEDCTQLVNTIEGMTLLLATNDVETVKLYTRILGIGDGYIARTDLVFDGERYSVNRINALLATNSKKVTDETVSIVEYNGSAANLPVDIYNAGVYKVKIGEAEPIAIEIKPAALNLTATGALVWRVGTSRLSDGPVYITDDTVTLTRPDGDYTVAAALSAVARSGGSQLTLGLTGAGFLAEVAQGSSATYTEVGQYTTVFTLTSDGNYAFTANGTAEGLTVELNADGTATVTKTWYIVDMANWFVFANDGNKDYEIADREYGRNVTLLLPGLKNINYDGNTEITFKLSYNGVGIKDAGDNEEFAIETLGNYINNMMPVGRYVLTLIAPEVRYYEEFDMETGAPIVDSLVVCPAFEQDILFEVTAADATGYGDLVDIINGKTFEYIYGTPNPDNAAVIASFNAAFETWTRTLLPSSDLPDNHWTVAGAPVIEVNNASALDNNFGAFPSELAVGVYNYYYRIRIDNFNTVDSVDGELLGFTVVVYGVVEVAPLPSLEYTGFNQVAAIPDSDLYRTTQNDGGTRAGAYDVILALIHPECYIWAGQTLDEHSDEITLSFQISQATNRWLKTPNIVNWTFDSFDAEINRIRAVPFFNDSSLVLHFMIAYDEAGLNAVEGLENFTVDSQGRVIDETVIGLLNGLPVNTYYLISTVDETENYGELVQPIAFNVTKAINAWASGEGDLVLPSWVVGKYDPAVNVIAVNPMHGTANIRITDIDGNEYYNSATGLNKLADAPVGKYLLIAWVDETGDFAALAERSFTIEVLEKVGLPWWGTLLIVIGALAVVAVIVFVLWKKGVFQILTGKLVIAIRTKATVDATIAAVRANKRAEEAKASVAEAKRKEAAAERRAKAAEERSKPVEERAAALEAKAAAAAARAEKMRARAEAMQAKAARMKEQAEGVNVTASDVAVKSETPDKETEVNTPQAETPATDTTQNVTEPQTPETEAAVNAEAAATEEVSTANSNNRPAKKSGAKNKK